jgi:hypothetical protein
MTDRYSGFVVTLKDDIREDEADNIIKALSMVKGVLTVRPSIDGGTLSMAEDCVKHRYYMAMHDAVRAVFNERTELPPPPAPVPPPAPRRGLESWQWSAMLVIALAAGLANVIVGFHRKDARVEALQKMEKACAGH